MRFAIIYSEKDSAGRNIIKNLRKLSFLPQTRIIKIKKEIIYFDINKHNLKNIDFIIFASKHESLKKQNSLTIHAPGNFRNSLGGINGKLSNTSCFVLKYLFKELNKNPVPGYNITLECTHHGPSINIPCCFIEIGSTEEQWNDENAGRAIAKTIISLQNYKQKNNKNYIPSIGIGGPHYCPNFNKIQLNSNYAIGHIFPSYNFPLTQPILKEIEEKTKESVKLAILDWKSFKSEERKEIISLLNKFNLNYKRTSDIDKNV